MGSYYRCRTIWWLRELLVFKSWPTTCSTIYSCATLGKLLNLSGPQFPNLWNRNDNNTIFIRLLWELSEIIFINCLEESLTHGRYLVNAILEELFCNIIAQGNEKIWGYYREREVYESKPVKLFMNFWDHLKLVHVWMWSWTAQDRFWDLYQEIDQCAGQRLTTGSCTYETDLNCITKALKTELTSKPQPTEGWLKFAAWMQLRLLPAETKHSDILR